MWDIEHGKTNLMEHCQAQYWYERGISNNNMHVLNTLLIGKWNQAYYKYTDISTYRLTWF